MDEEMIRSSERLPLLVPGQASSHKMFYISHLRMREAAGLARPGSSGRWLFNRCMYLCEHVARH